MTAPWDLVIVGGGPAGLTAACTAAAAGLRAVILDESDELGGQYFRQLPPALRAAHDHRPEGRRLIDRVYASGVTVLTGHTVWGVGDSGALLAAPRAGGATARLDGRYVLIAAGAHELVLPFPGWTLPGVVTPGFALHTAVLHRAKLGERVVLAGTGPFLLLVAQELLHAGVNVVAVADEADLAVTPVQAGQALRHPQQVIQFGHMLGTLARRRVPWRRATRLAAAEGGRCGVESVVFASSASRPGGGSWRVRADVLCVAYGFKPNSELPRRSGSCREPGRTDHGEPGVCRRGRGQHRRRRPGHGPRLPGRGRHLPGRGTSSWPAGDPSAATPSPAPDQLRGS
jgi:NADPH-dependent 2,4-dienoyl-CoA reductase/sulfur reductase-like enzyme